MIAEKSNRPLTLRQLLTSAEKFSRDLVEQVQVTFLPCVEEFRKLSRPVRHHSRYPTMLAIQNALKKLKDLSDETRKSIEFLKEQLQEIRENALRERARRI